MRLQNKDTSYPISQCQECHSYYFDPIPTDTALEAHYSDGYNFYRGNNPKQFGRGQGFAEVYLHPHKQHGTLLDIGCGAADFLLGIEKQSEWKTTGLDINENAINDASQRTGLELIYGDIFSPQLDGKSFDCIHLRDVIEHVPAPKRFLERATDLLTPDGFIYVRIPNGTNEIKPKIRQFNKDRQAALTTPGHIFYISNNGFQKLTNHTGLEIASSKSFGLKNGLRNLGLFPIPKRSHLTNPKKSSPTTISNSSKTTFQHTAEKAANKFIRQERNLRRGANRFYLEHIYLLIKSRSTS